MYYWWDSSVRFGSKPYFNIHVLFSSSLQIHVFSFLWLSNRQTTYTNRSLSYRTKSSGPGNRGRQITTLSGKLLDLYESIRDHQDSRGRTLSSPFMKVPSKSVSCRNELINPFRPEFFYFSFYRTSRPNFLKIENK